MSLPGPRGKGALRRDERETGVRPLLPLWLPSGSGRTSQGGSGQEGGLSLSLISPQRLLPSAPWQGVRLRWQASTVWPRRQKIQSLCEVSAPICKDAPPRGAATASPESCISPGPGASPPAVLHQAGATCPLPTRQRQGWGVGLPATWHRRQRGREPEGEMREETGSPALLPLSTLRLLGEPSRRL